MTDPTGQPRSAGISSALQELVEKKTSEEALLSRPPRFVAHYLAEIERARENYATWEDLAELFRAHGLRNRNGSPVNGRGLRLAFFRVKERQEKRQAKMGVAPMAPGPASQTGPSANVARIPVAEIPPAVPPAASPPLPEQPVPPPRLRSAGLDKIAGLLSEESSGKPADTGVKDTVHPGAASLRRNYDERKE